MKVSGWNNQKNAVWTGLDRKILRFHLLTFMVQLLRFCDCFNGSENSKRPEKTGPSNTSILSCDRCIGSMIRSKLARTDEFFSVLDLYPIVEMLSGKNSPLKTLLFSFAPVVCKSCCLSANLCAGLSFSGHRNQSSLSDDKYFLFGSLDDLEIISGCISGLHSNSGSCRNSTMGFGVTSWNAASLGKASPAAGVSTF